MRIIKISFCIISITSCIENNNKRCDVELDFGFESQEVNLCSLKKDLPCPLDEIFCYEILSDNLFLNKTGIIVLEDSTKEIYLLKDYSTISLDTINTKENLVFGYNFMYKDINYVLFYVSKSFYNRSTTRTDTKAYLFFNQKVIELPHLQNTVSGKNISDFNRDGHIDYVYLDELDNKVFFYSLNDTQDEFLLNDEYYISLEYLGGVYRIEENSRWFGKNNKIFLMTEKYPCNCGSK